METKSESPQEQTNVEQQVPSSGVLKRKAAVLVHCNKQAAFDYISSSDLLSQWLKKSGPVPGVVSVDVLKGPYNFSGAQRKIFFDGNAHAIEELMTHHPPGNYAYNVQHFNNFLEKLSGEAYGQLWFDTEGTKTRITWEYTFKYHNLFSRIVLSLFLTFAYKRFMKKGLVNAKNNLEATS